MLKLFTLSTLFKDAGGKRIPIQLNLNNQVGRVSPNGQNAYKINKLKQQTTTQFQNISCLN